MFRRPRLRFTRAQMLGSMEMSQLQNANKLIASGQPEKAAPIYLQLARELQSTQQPRKAANMHAMHPMPLQIERRKTSFCCNSSGVAILSASSMMPRGVQFYGNILNKLNQNGWILGDGF